MSSDKKITQIFSEIFKTESQVSASAHGRVNLIGEHTDYNGGFVLPTNIPQKTEVALSKRSDNEVHLFSANFAAKTSADKSSTTYTLGDEYLSRHWSDYIKGITFLLKKDGHQFSGFNCCLRSNVPIGSGLSSSAALEVAVLKGLVQLFKLDIDGVQIAKLGQRVENDFVGARIGIMDQMVASLGTMGEALFIDTKDLSYKNLPLPTSMELLVINSGVEHSNVHGDYNQRRSECEQACAALKIKELRDLGIDDLGKLKTLPDTLARRARHVITENQRVLDAVKALQSAQYAKMGELFSASHASMRDDYKVSIPEIDTLVEITSAESGVLGARLTGGGFGGSIVALLKPGLGRSVGERVVARYLEKTSKQAAILVPER